MSKLSKMPRECFSENVNTTLQDDRVAFKSAEMLNPRRLMWANDFPHSTTWSNSQELLCKHSQPLTEDQKSWILHDKVAEL
jgi:predicted TIM-barrel fold metal-dependent hydrolase